MTLVAAAILSASTVIGFGCYTDLALGKETNTVPGHHVPASLFSGASANQCARPSIAGNMPSGVSRLLQQGLDCPTALVLSGALLVVANAFGGYSNDGYVAEFDTATGKLVRVISGPAYRFDGPGAMAVDGAHLFVASSPSNVPGSLTEVTTANREASTGHFGSRLQVRRPWCHGSGRSAHIRGGLRDLSGSGVSHGVQLLDRGPGGGPAER